MEMPPFRLSRLAPGQPGAKQLHPPHPSEDRCCGPTPVTRATATRRARLAELDPHFHCSVIGTCLTTAELRKLAFGDVHMLSHLVGAANRADIRRLVALEDENVALRSKIERQQHRLRTFAVERDAEVRGLRATIESLSAAASRRAEPAGDGRRRPACGTRTAA
ncbi:hypothetical protein [Burkholderia ubonensis]|uniref:hypothetical protein n=1 Tax=Burkholderia ubonensis TaxID=101571 RepID=UPI000751E3C1|nr:hypothetical protein [Burkholderia ubonensis]KVZ37851.1 hypothetical protein WL17_18550 [Burkholderia ubonensis]